MAVSLLTLVGPETLENTTCRPVRALAGWTISSEWPTTGRGIDGFGVGRNFLGPCFSPMISAMVIDISHVDSVRRDRLHAQGLQGQNGLRETYPDPRSG